MDPPWPHVLFQLGREPLVVAMGAVASKASEAKGFQSISKVFKGIQRNCKEFNRIFNGFHMVSPWAGAGLQSDEEGPMSRCS